MNKYFTIPAFDDKFIIKLKSHHKFDKTLLKYKIDDTSHAHL